MSSDTNTADSDPFFNPNLVVKDGSIALDVPSGRRAGPGV